MISNQNTSTWLQAAGYYKCLQGSCISWINSTYYLEPVSSITKYFLSRHWDLDLRYMAHFPVAIYKLMPYWFILAQLFTYFPPRLETNSTVIDWLEDHRGWLACSFCSSRIEISKIAIPCANCWFDRPFHDSTFAIHRVFLLFPKDQELVFDLYMSLFVSMVFLVEFYPWILYVFKRFLLHLTS